MVLEVTGPRVKMLAVPSGGSLGELVPLPFPDSGGHLHPLAHGPILT